MDSVLPFELRSALVIFSAVADALEWIAKVRGAIHLFHYINNFIAVGPPCSNVHRRTS